MTSAASSTPAAPRWIDGYLAGLALTAPFVPTVAAVVSVISYELLLIRPHGTSAVPGDGRVDPVMPIAIGLIAAGLAWLLLGLVARALSSADSSQPRLFSELRDRHRLLSDRVPPPGSLPKDVPPGALQEVVDLLDLVGRELAPPRSGPALRWALGYGYVNVLRQLHRASEVMILLETRDAVIGDALDDELSLETSTIDGRDRLRGILRSAIHQLSPAAADAFLPIEPGTTAASATLSLTEMEAREAVREVDHAIKEFRDDRRDGLIGARNNLIWTQLAVALPAYLLLGLAMIETVPSSQVVAASAFFLVGAVVGLFQRLNSQAMRETSVEDFGLYQARLIVAPLLSGVAAVGGVFLVTAAPALTPGSQGIDLPTALASAFDLAAQPIGLVYAAIFGLTPALLTSQLDKQATKLTEDLAASLPATSVAA